MEILLDTCTFLWLISDDDALTQTVRRLYSDPQNHVSLSAASAWEIAIKYSLGKLILPENPITYIPRQREKHGITKLDITEEAVLYLTKLPLIHKDPFDRLLVCQSIITGNVILTPDPLIQQYPIRTVWS